MREREQPGAIGQEAGIGVEIDLAAPGHRNDPQPRPRLLAEQLPGHDVRVVLEVRDHDLVARAQAWPAPALRHEVDRFGRAAHEHDLAGRTGVDEALHAAARALEEIGRLLAQGMHATMDVRVRGLVVARHRVDDRLRPLARRGVVEVGERPAVDHAGQHREIAAHACDVERRGGLGHGRAGHGVHAASARSRSRRRLNSACTASAKGSRSMRDSTAPANARVSALRAAGSSRPRERR